MRERVRRNRGDAGALHDLGVVLAARGEYRRSFAAHRAAADCQPRNVHYLDRAAGAALTIGRLDDAARYIESVLSIDPSYVEAWRKRAQLQFDGLGKPAEALDSSIRAIELEPDNPHNYQTAARCVLSGGGGAEAIARLRTAMRCGVDSSNIERGTALALAETGRYEDAIAILQNVLVHRPRDQTPMRLLAEMYTGLHEWESARCWYEKAARASNDPLPVIGLLLHWSRLGDFERAREICRSRMLGENFERFLGPAAGRWTGQDIRGKTLHVIAGDLYFGDALQYGRLARLAREAGARVVLQAPKRLRSLLRASGIADTVIAPHDPLPPVDLHARAFWSLYTTSIPIERIIGETPYLRAPCELCADWRTRIPQTGGTRAGIVWRGSAYRSRDRFGSRSMPLESLRPLIRVPDLTLYSFQYGDGRGELWNADPPFAAIDLAPDFSNTAAAMEALDVVITVDTSIAHLAGALGKRTFLMLPYDACFRWMIDRDDTPWYRSLRLFRQTKPGEWSDVVESVTRALAS
ncbi:MAG TPA: tetratricopeptide repeat protein [Bryobacteraceae bacterium]